MPHKIKATTKLKQKPNNLISKFLVRQRKTLPNGRKNINMGLEIRTECEADTGRGGGRMDRGLGTGNWGLGTETETGTATGTKGDTGDRTGGLCLLVCSFRPGAAKIAKANMADVAWNLFLR